MFKRILSDQLLSWASKPFVTILFGARQTGKTTLLRSLFPHASLWIDLSDPAQRAHYLSRPGAFSSECKALKRGSSPHVVVIDEAQSVPTLFDAVQSLYDSDKHRWHFVLCGSSARKLRTTSANLLPGRSVYFTLYSLCSCERPFIESSEASSPEEKHRILPCSAHQEATGVHPQYFPPSDLETRLAFGELPGIALAEENDRAMLLKSYALIYLEEEIRREALVKEWGAFVRFLRLAAVESGMLVNYSSIAREAGISVPTVKSYYQLLEDMFVGFRVPAFSKSKRKHIVATPKFYFFDTGVRHAAAGADPSRPLVALDPGRVFEQWVAQELWKRLGYLHQGALYYFRTKSGVGVDFVVEHNGVYIPVEVKWTEYPTSKDARHVLDFMRDVSGRCDHGYIVCRCPRPMEIAEKVTAIPYWLL